MSLLRFTLDSEQEFTISLENLISAVDTGRSKSRSTGTARSTLKATPQTMPTIESKAISARSRTKDLWREIKSEMLNEIQKVFLIPRDLTQEHLRLFYSDSNDSKTFQLISQNNTPTFRQGSRRASVAIKKTDDFSAAVSGLHPGQGINKLAHFSPDMVLFVCFVDSSESDTPSSNADNAMLGELKLRCPHFRNKCGIKRHVQTGKIGFEQFSTAKEVWDHIVALHGTFKFKCQADKCMQRFKTKQQMQNHLYSIHQGESEQDQTEQLMREKVKFKCAICLNRQFISKCKLDWHMKCHERKFKCPISGCGKSFKQKQHLKNHALTHADDQRPYRCMNATCGKSFKSISHLKDHTQGIHLKLKPFECAFCKGSFSRNSTLKFHLKSLHGGLLTADGKLSDKAKEQLQIIRDNLTLGGKQDYDDESLPNVVRLKLSHQPCQDDTPISSPAMFTSSNEEQQQQQFPQVLQRVQVIQQPEPRQTPLAKMSELFATQAPIVRPLMHETPVSRPIAFVLQQPQKIPPSDQQAPNQTPSLSVINHNMMQLQQTLDRMTAQQQQQPNYLWQLATTAGNTSVRPMMVPGLATQQQQTQTQQQQQQQQQLNDFQRDNRPDQQQ